MKISDLLIKDRINLDVQSTDKTGPFSTRGVLARSPATSPGVKAALSLVL